MEEFASTLVPGKLYFGGMPSKRQLRILQEQGVHTLVNVMTEEERRRFPYETCPLSLQMNVLYFPIVDQNIPQNAREFTRWIHRLSEHFDATSSRVIYIHCRGGHGRSALVSGCLLLYASLFHNAQDCIRFLTQSHRSRKILNPKYLHQPCPVAHCQRMFLKDFSVQLST